MKLHHVTRTRQFCTTAVLVSGAIALLAGCTDDTSRSDGVNADLRDISGRKNELRLVLRDTSLQVGDTATVSLANPRNALTSESKPGTIRFRTTDSTIVRVNSAGVMTALRAGTATITVRAFSGSGAVAVTVAAVAATPTTPTAPATPAVPATAGNLPAFVVPRLPTATVSIELPSAPQRSIRVPAGDAGALQAALDAATGGDEIVLADGAVYTGSFHLPNRSGGGTVVLRSASLPVASRTRITPSQGGSIATLLTNSVFPALVADDGAHGWRVVGVKLRLADGVVDNYGIVTLGSGTQTSVSQFPRDIVLDRVIVAGSVTGTTSRCVSLNGLSLAVIDSWLSECHARGRDAQAIASWTGTGPLLIENNHLEGSGQAILLGGADPLIAGVLPADVTVRRNHLYKPMSWAGMWTVKAAFEIKNAERVLFEGNVIENHWADAQVGFAILMQAASQDNRAAWSTIRDVTLRMNAIRNSRSGINILSRIIVAGGPTLQPSRRILVADNSFETVGRDPVSGASGRFIQLLDDLEDVTVVQNTFFGPEAATDVMMEGAPMSRLVMAHNAFGSAAYGVIGTGFAEGTSTLAKYAPGAVLIGNVMTGRSSAAYPAGNMFPATLSATDFVDAGVGNLTLRVQSGFSVANGARVGVDGASVLTAIAGATAR